MGVWLAQSVKYPTLDFSTGFDLKVVSSSPTLGVKPPKKKEKSYKPDLGKRLYVVDPCLGKRLYVVDPCLDTHTVIR